MEENKIKSNNTIVPAYMKNTKEVKEESKDKNSKKVVKKKDNSKRIKKIIKLAIILLAIILVIVGIVFLIRVIKYSKYEEYTKQMDKFGLSFVYDNGKSTSFEKVTKSEAMKVIISSLTSFKSMQKLVSSESQYENEPWVTYAISKGIITEKDINKDNQSNKITFAEFVAYFANARIKIAGQTLDTSIYPNYSDIDSVTSEQLYAISDLIANGVIENSNSKINANRVLYKGELNKYAVEIIKKFNLFIPAGKKFNISEEKIPSNIDEYTYTLFDVDKETYEKAFIVKKQEEFMNPVKVYPNIRTNVEFLMDNVHNYYNAILNIDYETIDITKLQAEIKNNALFEPEITILQQYVEYNKNNKIKLKGTATTQIPIIYYDGINYRVRTKIELEILNSNTKENLLYLDLQDDINNIIYDNTKYTFYVDVKIDSSSKDGIAMYVWEDVVYNQKTDESIEGISVNPKEEEILVIE